MHSLDPEKIYYEETLPGGAHWSLRLRRGRALRLTDIEGNANVGALFFNAEEKLERYNMADTLKAQHIAFLSKNFVCYSDMGRVMCSIIEDTRGWHDTFCGVSDAAMVREKYGEARYQEHRNDYYRNGRDSLLTELGKYGLGKRDLVPNVNFFSKVAPDADGNLAFESHGKAGDYIDLRADMDLLVLLHTCPHPLDTATAYQPGPIGLTVWQADPPGPDDPCRLSRPENERGFTNNERFFC